MQKAITTVDALNKTLEAPAVDPVLLTIANLYLSGNRIEKIAEDLEVPADRIVSVLDKPEVKSYIDGVMANQGYINRINRIELISKVIEQKIEEAKDAGILSRKDILDWVKLAGTVEEQLRPNKKEQQGPAVAVQINNYEKFMKNIMED